MLVEKRESNRAKCKNQNKMNELRQLENAFKHWLYHWHVIDTGYWGSISLWERDIIVDKCWDEFLETWRATRENKKKLDMMWEGD